jgi:hypothetical protein
MAELELKRTREDRRRYVVDGVGNLRLEGLTGRRATVEAGQGSREFRRTGFWQRSIEATDSAGKLQGRFEPRTLRRGGTLHWGGRELTLRPASAWRERYALVDGDRELVVLDGKGWGKRPVVITVDDPRAIDPALLLFAAFVVRGLAEDAGAAAGGSAATAATG